MRFVQLSTIGASVIWLAFLFIGSMVGIGAVTYIVFRMAKLGFIQRLSKKRKGWARVISLCILAAVAIVLIVAMGVLNTIICFIHLFLVWAICDLVGKIVRKASKREFKGYCAGIVAILLTVLYLGYGWYSAHHVVETDYKISAGESLEIDSLRVVGFADSHVGATFNWQGFSEHMEEIEALDPDIVVIAGDFVDDGTTREDMIESCKALGQIESTYGVYYIYGNHDKGYFGSESRGFSAEDLVENLEANGVVVLDDDVVNVVGSFYIIGRQDASSQTRAPISELSAGYSDDDFLFVLDHQPNDYDAEAAAKVDLVFSGHTHGGQFWPIRNLGVWLGMNDLTYGYEKRNDTEFIVTSGIVDWEVKFKTGCVSEIVVIDIER